MIQRLAETLSDSQDLTTLIVLIYDAVRTLMREYTQKTVPATKEYQLAVVKKDQSAECFPAGVSRRRHSNGCDTSLNGS